MSMNNPDENKEPKMASGKLPSAERPNASSSTNFAGVNELDDIDRVMKWLLQGKIDTRHMAMELPHTCDDLENGIVSTDDLYETLKRKLNASIVVPNDEGIERSRYEHLAHHLTKEIILTSWCRNDDQHDWLKKARVEFAGDLYRSCDAIEQEDYDSILMEWITITTAVQQAVLKTCNEWASRVDEALFKGRKGTFLFLFGRTNLATLDHCNDKIRDFMRGFTVEDIDADDLIETGFHDMKDNVMDRKVHLKQSIKLVAAGAHAAFKSCWECGKVQNKARVCSACHVAAYCSDNCHRAAWKGGHKKRCKTLKCKYEMFMENYNEVNQAHETGVIEGIKLNRNIDYIMCEYLSIDVEDCPFPTLILPPDPDSDEKYCRHLKPQGPSMKTFYENLGRISRGDFWIYPNPDSMESYGKKIGKPENLFMLSDEDKTAFEYLLTLIAYDIVGYLEFFDEDERSEVLSSMVEHSTAKEAREAIGATMPAERFLKRYAADAKSRETMRSNTKLQAFLSLREKFHK